ncbi:transcriptional regulator [Williamsia sp. 1138]|uniref:Helix-turn-helix transcriptional regulator n=1 Tax=Gordonia rubripertincta TaxID=36822 RepID=A0ABT4MSQ0_GORRU|nr:MULTISPECIES: helix-turn-helix transcriptional regulator [Mycobacteriales]MCZ4549849.1 helix-turn-helix transcriptional regulator [Gordonia rubripertincta]OZG25925.1 transcriptional regulator [Williamsia sp. 1138]
MTDRQRYLFGDLLRDWRTTRRVPQLELASAADVSARHLSFLETGRSAPSRTMVLKLADHLDVPLRERNQLLLAAGFAPSYGESPLDGERMTMVRSAIRQVLTATEPFPALAIDRHWNLVDANAAVAAFTHDAPEDLLAAPFNVLKFSLDPRGLGGRIINLGQWRTHLFERLDRQIRVTGDPALTSLLAELKAFPAPEVEEEDAVISGDVAVYMRLRADDQELSFFSTVTTFGTPLDVTVDELSVESFYPADDKTAEYLRRLLP